MNDSPSPATTATWVIPKSRRNRANFWRLARFVFLASLSAGFAMTWGLMQQIDARAAKCNHRKHMELSHRIAELEEDQRANQRDMRWVVTTLAEHGVHTRLCTTSSPATDASTTTRVRCAQAAK